MTICRYFPECTGCTQWNESYTQQKDRKVLRLTGLLSAHNLYDQQSVDFISVGDRELRHRVDFTLIYDENKSIHKFGFYDKNKKLIDIEQCLQLSSALQKVYSEFIQFNFTYGNLPIKKGSVRLRVSPDGLKGCWLDFSNLDIKNLLIDGKLFKQLLDSNFIVEIGQKGKKLVRINEQYKLSDPEAQQWFETLGANNEALPLKSLISDFTQPSWISAKALVKETLQWIKMNSSIQSVLEFGPGIGQFTLALLSQKIHVDACEINKSSIDHLQLNAKLLNLDNYLTLHHGDFHKSNLAFNKKIDLVFVNPARSGLKDFTKVILSSNADYIIYVSCFPESMIQDFINLRNEYSLCNIKIIDQFPQTEHFETFAVLKKLN